LPSDPSRQPHCANWPRHAGEPEEAIGFLKLLTFGSRKLAKQLRHVGKITINNKQREKNVRQRPEERKHRQLPARRAAGVYAVTAAMFCEEQICICLTGEGPV